LKRSFPRWRFEVGNVAQIHADIYKQKSELAVLVFDPPDKLPISGPSNLNLCEIFKSTENGWIDDCALLHGRDDEPPSYQSINIKYLAWLLAIFSLLANFEESHSNF